MCAHAHTHTHTHTPHQGRDRQLAIPHLSVESIASINWAALKAAGFKGVVFDKDNTLSEPYAMEVSVHSLGFWVKLA